MRPKSNFFSSLSRLEKRLKLETPPPQHHQQQPTPQPPNPKDNTDTQQTDSLGSPIYLYHSHPPSTCNPSNSNLQESEPPQAFFSIQDNPDSQNQEKVKETGELNEIEMLLQLLGLYNDDEEEKKGISFDEIFYGKIVGVKGLKNRKELERLNGWIKYFMNKDGDGGIKQPFRLAHLLLAKASFVHSGYDDLEGLQFPSTVEEFLHYDPPGN